MGVAHLHDGPPMENTRVNLVPREGFDPPTTGP